MQEDSSLRRVDSSRPRRDSRWSAATFFVVLGLAVLIAVLSLFLKRPISDATAAMAGRALNEPVTRIEQYDYGFEPRHITWRAGDQVTISLHNRSTTHWHEMMLGRGYDFTPSVFGPIATQFDTDFWNGIHVTFSGANHVDNLCVNKAIAKFIGPMPNVVTGGNFSPTLQPGGSLNMTFTVPNKPGTWYYGCFVQQYMHYIAGMRGTITILPR
ncbi:hypothetical protein [Ferroacidibacillus organovorans]|uniref:Blue (type 1) copper domain-containing protein n=1 Tax=Ferroacidibacillus organovorans TaxID=1765683 RepID=A0A101XPT2_9BACL|nr:hypothetical protein [Ferroacidibacillus organovorans]KUO95363.1 hypothetical protein ATW55_10935 [Ferroacidibacillus organovorans]